MVEGGISSTWWVTVDRGAARVIGGDGAERRDHRLAPRQVERRGGLVQHHQLGVGHQRPREQHALALALREIAEPPLQEAAAAEPLEEPARRARCRRPAAGRAVARRSRSRPSAPRRARSARGRTAAPPAAPETRSARAARACPPSPSRPPRIVAVPALGCPSAAAIVERVLLPAPFGPSTTHRSPAPTRQSMFRRISSRRLATALNRQYDVSSSSIARVNRAAFPPILGHAAGDWGPSGRSPRVSCLIGAFDAPEAPCRRRSAPSGGKDRCSSCDIRSPAQTASGGTT